MTNVLKIFIHYYLLLFSISLCGQVSINGQYSSDIKHNIVKINIDGTYYQEHSDCTYAIKAYGNWIIINDTLNLKANKVYSFMGGKKKLVTDTASKTYYYYTAFSKYLVSKDTLICLFKLPNGNTKIYYKPLVRQVSLKP